jgi:hypothetical protein
MEQLSRPITMNTNLIDKEALIAEIQRDIGGGNHISVGAVIDMILKHEAAIQTTPVCKEGDGECIQSAGIDEDDEVERLREAVVFFLAATDDWKINDAFHDARIHARKALNHPTLGG